MKELVGEALFGYLELGTVTWIIWWEHNKCTFDEMEHLQGQLLALFDWSCAWRLTSSDSLSLFIVSLLSCI